MEFVAQEEEEQNIWEACSDGDICRVQQLVGMGIGVNAQDSYGYSPLHAAASYGHLELVRYLMTLEGADVNIRDADGDTPILYCEEVPMFELLISLGADPEAVNNDGEGIFQKCIEDENDDLMNYLVARGLGKQPGEIPTFEFTNNQEYVPEEDENDMNEETC